MNGVEPAMSAPVRPAAAVIGSGAWGTTFASLLAQAGTPTTIWARRQEVAEEINAGTNERYVPGHRLPQGLKATTDLAEAVAGAGIVVVAVPSQEARGVLEPLRCALADDAVAVSLMKGIELGTGLRMSEVLAEALGIDASRVVVVSGPNLADEIAAGQPTATVVAAADEQIAARIASLCATGTFRPYTNTDVIGAEIGGACKNVIALACGMASGNGLGENTLASLITRGLAEITRLGTAMGADPRTFAGLAGLGDLVATCSSPLSRNRTFGYRLGQGGTLEEATQATNGQVAEGVTSSAAINALAHTHNVEMPITQAVYGVCHQGLAVIDMVAALMGRTKKSE